MPHALATMVVGHGKPNRGGGKDLQPSEDAVGLVPGD
jgi:hypothetical protein